jgi:hypothetical protein
MTARRATPMDNDLLYRIVMHPEVRGWVSHDGAPDFDPHPYTREGSEHIAIVVDRGCFLLPRLEMGAYAVHTQFLPNGRGANAVREAGYMLNWMFLNTDAEQIVSMVPDNNPQALRFAHQMAFRDTYRREGKWVVDGVKHALQYLRLDLDEWVLSRPELRAIGQGFHEQLGPEHVNHEEDPLHDAYVGAAFAMIQVGRAQKGQWLYNRWARATGYHPFTILSTEPMRLDLGTCTVRIDSDQVIVEEAAHA